MPKHLTTIALAVACLTLTIVLWQSSRKKPAFERLVAAPADDPPEKANGAGSAQGLVTEYLNLRPLAEKLRPPGYVGVAGSVVTHLSTEEETCEEIGQLISQRVAPDSWHEAGGNLGQFHQIAGIMIVTQTAENLRSIHALLRRLEAATDDRDWLASANRQRVAAPIDSGKNSATTKPIPLETGYFNIRRLVDEIRSAPPTRSGPFGTNFDVVKQITDVMEAAVAPASWEDNGGPGSMRLLGEVLVITQTPENLKACREVLVNLHLTGPTGDSARAATRSSS
ncbi:MAG TPA: hypothetical protein VFE47_02690 [Tepidisphaeraceae bacterium]|jgi:hypothetical protein|nr:hypothetical protein [Tepidisphaeraceae bacterium]